MRLTDDKIITAIFSATIKQLPREALLMVDGGYTLTPDDGYWMDKAIRIASAERSAILWGCRQLAFILWPNRTISRQHLLAMVSHLTYPKSTWDNVGFAVESSFALRVSLLTVINPRQSTLKPSQRWPAFN